MDYNKADITFVQEMIPHHEEAVQMANILLDNGIDPKISKIARAVIKAQTAEIKVLREWLLVRGLDEKPDDEAMNAPTN